MPGSRFLPPVLDELLALGIQPRDGTVPARVRAHLNDLYTYELRKLRGELVQAEKIEGRKLRVEYGKRVMELRHKYALLSLPVESWSEATIAPKATSAPEAT